MHLDNHAHSKLHEALARCWLHPEGTIWLVVDTYDVARRVHRELEHQEEVTALGGFRYRVGRSATLAVLSVDAGERAFCGQRADYVVTTSPLPPRIAEEVLNRLAATAGV